MQKISNTEQRVMPGYTQKQGQGLGLLGRGGRAGGGARVGLGYQKTNERYRHIITPTPSLILFKCRKFFQNFQLCIFWALMYIFVQSGDILYIIVHFCTLLYIFVHCSIFFTRGNLAAVLDHVQRVHLVQ